MPILPENVHRYPANWHEIRARVLERAGHRCEKCGVKNYALGGRTKEGLWLPALPLGEKLLRLEWPRPGAHSPCGHYVGEIGKQRYFVGETLRVIRIVLTIAHLDHTPENCALDNLRAWCQRCHLAYDRTHHRETRRARWACGDLFSGGNAR